jgi:hypothetical protein
MANKMRLGAHDNLASFPHSICWPIMERCVASLIFLLLALAGLAAAQGRCCRCSFRKIFLRSLAEKFGRRRKAELNI